MKTLETAITRFKCVAYYLEELDACIEGEQSNWDSVQRSLENVHHELSIATTFLNAAINITISGMKKEIQWLQRKSLNPVE